MVYGRMVAAIGLAGAIFISLAPFLQLRSLTYFFLLIRAIILVQSFNLIAGYVGYVSFGHVVFFGIGGYITAILVWKAGLASYYYIPVLLGGLGSAGAAALFGAPLLKLRGAYFAIATLALNEAVRVVIHNIPAEFGGGSFGIPLPTMRKPMSAYYAILGVAVLMVACLYLLMRSRYGVVLKAIREDEDTATVMGINAPRYKVRAFSLSAFFMGLAGGLDLQFTGYIYPEAAFNIETNVEVIAMTMLGGGGTIAGPVLGAVILYVIGDYFWAKLPFFHLIVLGLALAIIVLFFRRGIMGTLEDRIAALRGKLI